MTIFNLKLQYVWYILICRNWKSKLISVATIGVYRTGVFLHSGGHQLGIVRFLYSIVDYATISAENSVWFNVLYKIFPKEINIKELLRIFYSQCCAQQYFWGVQMITWYCNFNPFCSSGYFRENIFSLPLGWLFILQMWYLLVIKECCKFW